MRNLLGKRMLMKLLLVALLCLWPARWATPNASAKAKGANQWALLVGINDYPGEIQDLRFAHNDARSIKDLLVSAAGFSEDHIQLLTAEGTGNSRATKQNIYAAIDQFLAPRLQQAGPNQQLIVFLAGHGIVQGIGPEAKSYFLPVDIEAQTKDSLIRTAIDLEELSRKLSALKAAQFTVFIDACREDPFPGRGIKGNTLTDVMARGLRITRLSANAQTTPADVPTSVVFYSCRIGERAYENAELQHGVFTYYILRGIRELAASPNGGVEAGLLAGYLTTNVRKWATEASQRTKIPMEQTPTMVALEVRGTITILNISPFSATSVTKPTTGAVTLATAPEGALVSLNGRAAGSGPLFKELAPGSYTVRAELPGFQTLETKVNVLPGYQQEISLPLQPVAANASFERGVQLENQQLWPQASAAYEQALREDASGNNAQAIYERLSNVYVKSNRYQEAVTLLNGGLQKFPDNALLLARRSRALSAWVTDERGQTLAMAAPLNPSVQKTAGPPVAAPAAEEEKSEKKSNKKGGKKKKDELKADLSFAEDFSPEPQKSSKKGGKQKAEASEDAETGSKKKSKKAGKAEEAEAPSAPAVPAAAFQPANATSVKQPATNSVASLARVAQAIRDAEAALQKEPNLAAAHLALGFAQLLQAELQAQAMAAFVRAATLTPDDAEAYFGTGYTLRLQQLYPQAVPQLKKAVELRPDYYEAQRELASCYFALGQTDQAIQQYQVVASQRRKTKRSEEMAANKLALASLYQKKGAELGGAEGEECKKASKAYETEAREFEPSLKGAVRNLTQAGVSTVIKGFLPTDARNNLDAQPTDGIKINIPVKGGSSNVPVTVPTKLLEKTPLKTPLKVLEKSPVKIPLSIPVKGASKDSKSNSSKGTKKVSDKIPFKLGEKATVPVINGGGEKPKGKTPTSTIKLSNKNQSKPVERVTPKPEEKKDEKKKEETAPVKVPLKIPLKNFL